MNQLAPESVTAYLHQQMPLTLAMGLKVTQIDDDMTRLIAPLEPNLNHQQTAFGGSIAALGITAGWVYLHARLHREGIVRPRLIIQKSQVEYLHPIASEMEACCGLPEAGEWEAFITRLRDKGRARINRPAQVQGQGRIGAIHHGTYVAIIESLAQRTGVMG